MANILLNDRIMVTVNGELCGQRTMNTFLYRCSATTPEAEQSAAFTALHAELNKQGSIFSGIKGCSPTNWTLTSVWYQVIAPARFRKMAFPIGAPGLFGGPSAVSNVQASITRVGEQAKRSHVGGVRIAIGGDTLSADNGSVHANLAQALQTLANAMKLNIITAAPVVTYIPQVGTPATPMNSVDLFNAIPQYTVRTMHRRTVGLGI